MYGEGLNFDPQDDAEILTLMSECVGMSDAALAQRLRDVRRYYDVYYMQLDRNVDNPYQINVRVGKAHSFIEQSAAKTVKNLFGQTPYLPLQPEDKDWRKNTEAASTMLDRESRRWKHFNAYTKACKITSIAGLSGLEPVWRVETKNVTKKVTRRKAGQTTGFDYVKQTLIEEGLDMRYIPLWALGWDPYQERTGRMRFFFEKMPVSRGEIMRQVNYGLWERQGKKVTAKDIKDKNTYGSGGLGVNLLNALQSDPSWRDSDMCVMLRFWLPDTLRYIVAIDGESIIGDYSEEESREYFVPIVPLIQTQEPWPNTLLGQSSMMPIENLSYRIDDSLANEMRKEQQEYGQVWMYINDVFPNVNALYPGGGSRIGVSLAQLKDLGMGPEQLQNLIQPIKQSARSGDGRYMREELTRYFNEAIRMDQSSRSAETTGNATAFEINKMTAATDEGFALQMKIVESCLEVVAHHAYKKLGDNITEKMARYYLGKDYRYFMHKTPDDIPGGCYVRLRGSALLAGQEADQNARMADLKILQPFMPPQVMQSMAKTYVMDATHWPSEMKDEVVKALDEATKQQEQQAAMQTATPGAPGGPVPGQVLEANAQPPVPTAVAA